jgi:hypothetical protein
MIEGKEQQRQFQRGQQCQIEREAGLEESHHQVPGASLRVRLCGFGSGAGRAFG